MPLYCEDILLSSFCTEEGTEKRNDVIKNHLESEGHTESLKSDNTNKLSKVMRKQGVPILKAVSVQNAELSSKIGGLIISLYSEITVT